MPPSAPDYTVEDLRAPETICCGVSRGCWILGWLLVVFVTVVPAFIFVPRMVFPPVYRPSFLEMFLVALILFGLVAICLFWFAWCYRQRWWITPRAIVHQGILFRTSVAIANVNHIEWLWGPKGVGIAIHSPQRRIFLPFKYIDYPDQSRLMIRCRQMIPAHRQAGWCEVFELHWRYPGGYGLESSS